MFPPRYLHGNWLDYLYWDTELAAHLCAGTMLCAGTQLSVKRPN
jgi:hypothetical protein